MTKLWREIQYREALGQERLSMTAFMERYAAIGYTFDRSCDARSLAKYMTGERAGESYPCVALYPIQADNGVSAWNVEARRDANFDAFKRLRSAIYCISRGAIVEV